MIQYETSKFKEQAGHLLLKLYKFNSVALSMHIKFSIITIYDSVLKINQVLKTTVYFTKYRSCPSNISKYTVIFLDLPISTGYVIYYLFDTHNLCK